MSVDPVAASLYPLLDPEWEAKTRRAGRLVLIPFIGWPMVLGYRKALIEHFHWPAVSAMPEWHGRHWEHCAHGFRAIGVIQVYLAPLWIALWMIAQSGGYVPGTGTWIGCAACLLFLKLTNIAFPVAVTALSLPIGEGPYVGRAEALVLMATFHAVIFLVPAGFLRVAATGRFRSAFDLGRTVPFVIRRWRDYLKAWWHALFMNVPPLPLFPFAPWGVFWGYVASVAIFNQLLLDESSGEGKDRPRAESWLVRSLHAPPPPSHVRILRTPWVTVPIPRRS